MRGFSATHEESIVQPNYQYYKVVKNKNTLGFEEIYLKVKERLILNEPFLFERRPQKETVKYHQI